jgi:hypothetical protein
MAIGLAAAKQSRHRYEWIKTAPLRIGGGIGSDELRPEPII